MIQCGIIYHTLFQIVDDPILEGLQRLRGCRYDQAEEARLQEADIAVRPRDVYLAACQQIANAFLDDDFRYFRSQQRMSTTDADRRYQISFQSSHYNVAGVSVSLWIYVTVWSRAIKKWREKTTAPAYLSDRLAGDQIGNLMSPPRWITWNLEPNATREEVMADAVMTIRRVAFPYFELFSRPDEVITRLTGADVLGLEPFSAIEFLLCFGRVENANDFLRGYFRRRPDLLPDYEATLDEIRNVGLPAGRLNGFAPELARATLTFGLTPPGP
jgi:hypothetical protein